MPARLTRRDYSPAPAAASAAARPRGRRSRAPRRSPSRRRASPPRGRRGGQARGRARFRGSGADGRGRAEEWKTGPISRKGSAIPAIDGIDAGGDSYHGADQATDPDGAERPPDEGADRDGRRRDADQDPACSRGLERLARAWLHPPGAYQACNTENWLPNGNFGRLCMLDAVHVETVGRGPRI